MKAKKYFWFTIVYFLCCALIPTILAGNSLNSPWFRDCHETAKQWFIDFYISWAWWIVGVYLFIAIINLYNDHFQE